MPSPQFYETLASSFSQTEALWEGLFSLASSAFILLTGLSFVRLDRARIKWRVKLARAFSSQIDDAAKGKEGEGESGGGRWALWGLPFLTVLREGLEGIVSARSSDAFFNSLSSADSIAITIYPLPRESGLCRRGVSTSSRVEVAMRLV